MQVRLPRLFTVGVNVIVQSFSVLLLPMVCVGGMTGLVSSNSAQFAPDSSAALTSLPPAPFCIENTAVPVLPTCTDPALPLVGITVSSPACAITGMVTPREGLVFGITLAVVSTAWFGVLVNWLSAWLSLGALLFYVVVYTMILKRRTSQNIVWGGIAGCMPVLIGWSAVTNSLSWAPVVLFMVIFFWTPPHYWPLSMKVREDYARVGVPMLPVIASNKVVARQIVIYSWVMVAVSLLLTPLGYTGWFYTAVALGAGGWWLWEAHALQNRAKAEVTGGKLKEMRLFHWSITYVSLLFVAVAVDPFLH